MFASARIVRIVLFIVVPALVFASCGGGTGGQGPTGDGQGLVLISFVQGSTDNVALNTVLEWRFSEPVNPATVTNASIQLREGGAFGLTVAGKFKVNGSTVTFEPQLPSFCDLSDAGFKADTSYRVQVVGAPEQFALQNTVGQKLDRTTTWEFSTRADSDPAKFLDQVPAVAPTVIPGSVFPAPGTAATPIGSPANPQRIVLDLTENVDPCSVGAATISTRIYEVGGSFAASVDAPNNNKSGFVTGASDVSDQTADPLTWGSDTGSAWPGGAQNLPVTIHLVQNFDTTRVIISPVFGQNAKNPELGGVFPDNVLIVVSLTFGIADFGGQPLAPFTLSFTTENVDGAPGIYLLANDGETDYSENDTTADVNTQRSPSVVQGFLLFAGDGDNGASLTDPSLPADENAVGGCPSNIPFQSNNNDKDHFDPAVDTILDTGAANACLNTVDGSTAVVWEFASMHIRGGITVHMIGENPAVILVQGDVTIDKLGRLIGRADGSPGVPRGRGENKDSTNLGGTLGGTGVLGAGNGGDGPAGSASARRVGGNGYQGYFMVGGSIDPSVGTTTGVGGGKGNTSAHWTAQSNPNNRNTPSGGGGGHAEDGKPGEANGTGVTPTKVDTPLAGEAGTTYGLVNGRLLTPEAGSGGGASGEIRPFSGTAGRGPGASGGAGGGFIDLTAQGDILIMGTIDVAGSPGGNGGGGTFSPNYSWQPGVGGGGGGSGGGLRLLTPAEVRFNSDTVVTAAGGPGGPSGASQGVDPAANNGGAGGNGRICIEDGDSIIAGLGAAAITPGEGATGFYRGVFDASRFSGGGLMPQAQTELITVGPFNPTFDEPVPGDFVAGAPSVTSPGPGSVVMLVEAQSFDIMPDGTPEAVGNGFRTIGHFLDSGIEANPSYVSGHPLLFPRPNGNIGNAGIDNMASLNGDEFVQIRITIYLSSGGIGALDPGAFLDDWTIRFNFDN